MKKPIDYLVELKRIAPSVAVSLSRTIDPYCKWDGDGPDPAEDGYDPYDVDVEARAIVNGETVEGTQSLGGSYYQSDEPLGDVHGYLPQMLQGAFEDLGKTPDLPDSLRQEIEAAIAYMGGILKREYDRQQTAKPSTE